MIARVNQAVRQLSWFWCEEFTDPVDVEEGESIP
jgi:hypothetical protein